MVSIEEGLNFIIFIIFGILRSIFAFEVTFCTDILLAIVFKDHSDENK